MTKKDKKTVNECSVCGMCKSNCPTYSILKNEVDSPRGKALLKKNNKYDAVFYNCTLCGACVVECPSNVDMDEEIRKVRKKLVDMGKSTPATIKMIENMKKYGNPYGKLEEGEVPKDLYCC